MRRILVFLCAVALLNGQFAVNENQHFFVHVTLGSKLPGPYSGRLLVFIAPGAGAKEVDNDEFRPSRVYVAAKEVANWTPGSAVDIDMDDVVFPGPFSQAKPGDYQMQAVLDVGRTYNYLGRGPGDLLSDVSALNEKQPSLTLTKVIPAQAKPALNGKDVHTFSFKSAALSRFWGRDTFIRGYVVTPPSYGERPKERFPTVYYTHGFGGNFERIQGPAEMFARSMAQKKMPEMIWVVLDESCPTGTHEFADSVNNGP